MGSKSPEPGPRPIKTLTVRARGYQYEMFDRSMRENVIVAMDTGSGKTHIALLRIMAEIDRCPPEKLVWFLAPTVALCTQQHASINSHLPSLRTRLLIGSDNVDRWSEQQIWDAVLANIQVVVSTHAVLADALAHGFVKMAQLALLIYDEAHHCARGHPANKIMQNFYHPQKAEKGPASVPHILGLSASPILRSKISELETIEANLASLSITPRVHRQELLRYVHRPTLHRLEYEPHDQDETSISSRALVCLYEICRTLKIQVRPTTDSSIPPKMQSTQIRPKLPCRTRLEDHLVKFCNKATHIYEELGPWAVDYFILESIAALETLNSLETDMFAGERNGDRVSLLRILKQGPLLRLLENGSLGGPYPTSDKVKHLMAFLGNQDCSECSGLLFVRQRATVSVLCTLLSIHPNTKGTFRCATFVGMSNNAAKRYTMAELLDLKAQRETLAEFRARRKNLIIATDALEEGIDVTACNLVICFDPPPNVKSFIQRRGRARQEKSNFAIMFPKNESGSKIDSWRALEANLIRAYQNELRQIKELAEIEDDAEVVPGKLETKSGACLAPDSAVAHLHHFCARLPHEPYVDLHPVFTFDENPTTKLITATVILPSCLNHSLRSTTGIGMWRTERAAARDAAFQAYVALYKAGLLNDNLLPLSHTWALEEEDKQECIDATVDVATQLSPWAELARAWSSPNIHQNTILLQQQGSKGQDDLLIVLTMPSSTPHIAPFDLYWDESTTFKIHFDPPRQASLNEPETVQIMRRITHTLSRSTHSDYAIDDRMDFIALFSPHKEESQLANWCAEKCGRDPALEKYHAKDNLLGCIRAPSHHNNAPHIFSSWNVLGADQDSKVEVECIPLPKRRHFLARNTLSKRTEPQSDRAGLWKLQSFPIEECTVDRLSFEYARFNLFIPAILQHLEIFMVADILRTTILRNVSIKDTRHIATAISAPSAGWVTNYQRYEFFGDTVLKFVVSYQLFCDNANWPEGYLSERKNRIVSNQRLAEGALLKGLDRYIMTDAFKARKWSPLLISEVESDSGTKRNISTKVIADVVEALIGAAYVDSGLNTARECIHAFLPQIRASRPPLTSHPSLKQNNSAVGILKAEAVIGHTFRDKTLLLEALTHPSCDRDIQTESYQRLEFLGDAVLDILVMSVLVMQQTTTELSQGQMTLVKAALVNTHFLGFLCLDFSIEEEAFTIKEQPGGRFTKQKGMHHMPLWSLMRHSNADIAKAQRACVERYIHLRPEIKHSLSEGKTYPWLQLTRLNLDKFFSDMIEGLIGAIFVDSAGSFVECQRFIARIGLVPYLRRVLAGGVDVSHPKTVLERLTGSESVAYDVHQEKSDGDGEGKRYGCTVKVGDVEVASVKGCLCMDEAVVIGAWEAAKKLRPGFEQPR